MIKASYTLNWSGGEYSVRLHRELVKAVQRSGEMIQRTAVKSLSVSGQAAMKPTGLNRAKGPGVSKMNATQKNMRILNTGISNISKLKTVKGVKTPTTLRFGGSYGGVDRIYWNNDTRRWTTSSPPGTPPHRQSGRLREIVVERVQGGLKAKVGPRQGLIYARIQELGGKAMIRLPARPYMRPAFEQNQQAILFQFALAVQKAAK